MAITIELPADLERDLRARSPDLDARAKLAVALELYRNRSISVARLAEMVDATYADMDEPRSPMEALGADELVSFKFHEADLARCDVLSAKASEGTLSPAETDELDAMLSLDTVLSLLRLQTTHPIGPSR